MNIRKLCRQYNDEFRNASFESPELESAYILSEVTGIRHTELFLEERELTENELEKAAEFFTRRLKHEPWQYIFGWCEFRFLTLKIGSGALIPRCETELLVDLVKAHVKPASVICELGTGSGAISLALASERQDLRVYASEKSFRALRWAMKNRSELELDNVSFLEGDLYSPFHGMKFDAIVANLPYIPFRDSENLPQNVRQYEPPEALFAEENGLELIRRAISECVPYLKYCGGLFFEIGEEQGAAVREMAQETGLFSKISIEKDQFGADRFLKAIR